MKKRYFNDSISEDSINKMITCFDPVFRDYQASETIISYSDQLKKVGILLTGYAKLYYINEAGETSLLETYSDGDIFGEIFSMPLDNFEYIVVADKPCHVIFLDYHHIIMPCEKSCQHHSQLINNLFIMTAQKSQELSFRISILNQHSTRKKLLAFLQYLSDTAVRHTEMGFEIPMTLGDLAEYLCVDRSAMMREIREMNKDGLIRSNRRFFKII